MRHTNNCLIPLAVVLITAFGCSQDSPTGPTVSQVDPDNTSRVTSTATTDHEQESVTKPIAAAVPVSQTTSHVEEQPINDGRDSDEPGSYKAPAPTAAHDHAHDPPTPEEIEQAKKDRQDGDDENAPIIIPKKEEQDETLLNNGREPTATPLPEDQRVAADPSGTESAPLNNGRNPDAKPGDETAVKKDDSPKSAKKAKKVEGRSRKSLSDLPESIQSLDKDADGQIGLYEWPRKTLNQFKELDTNDDGFLTPEELLAAQKASKAAKKDAKPATAESSESAKPAEDTTSEEEKE